MASIASVKNTRLRRSGTTKMLRTLLMKFSIMMLYLFRFRLGCDNVCRATGCFDLTAGRFAKTVSTDSERLRQLALPQHHNTSVSVQLTPLDHTTLSQKLRRDVVFSLEALIQITEIDLDPFLLEDVREAAFGQPPLKRHLTAF